MKQGRENFEIVKNKPESKNRNYIFKNDTITKVGFYIVVTVLVVGFTFVVLFGKELL
ncbi:hypothetical protein ACQY1Q_16170 [Tenacibaculum sp. TC6]|uniref:hypothetical protein n=1 Tax=Tenacibaculum sp. TC6 TaxID=3423223 RepID=UPI003D35CD96